VTTGSITRDTKITISMAASGIAAIATATIALSAQFTDVHYQLKSMNEKMERMIGTMNGHVERPALRSFLRELELLNPDILMPDYDF
jgi:hypothetical protein